MAAKIFYRERTKVKDGAKTPRYRIVAVSEVNLKIYANHLRKGELEHIAEELAADLVPLRSGPKHDKE